jgi:transcriptional regulator with XRE-family HTH domain
MISARQIRAARALLGLGQEDLASLAKCGIATIRRIEGSAGLISGNAQTIARIEKALEAAGIFFIEQDGKMGPGVRLRKPARP